VIKEVDIAFPAIAEMDKRKCEASIIGSSGEKKAQRI